MEEEHEKREQLIGKLIQKRKQEISAFNKLLEAIKSNQNLESHKPEKGRARIDDTKYAENNGEKNQT